MWECESGSIHKNDPSSGQWHSSCKSREHNPFCYIPNCGNSQLEYLLDERVHRHLSSEHSRTILDSLLHHGRNLLKSCQRPLTHRQNHKRMNDEVVTDDFHIYNDEWLRMKGTRRGFVMTTCGDGTDTTKNSDMPIVHLRCFLPPGEWTNFINTATTMKDFASSFISKLTSLELMYVFLNCAHVWIMVLKWIFDLQMSCRP